MAERGGVPREAADGMLATWPPGDNRKLLASAGLDREVIIWDVEATKGVWSSGRHDDRVHLLKATGHKDSVYCLAANGDGTVIVSGSPERVSTHAIGLLRIWDPRTGQKVRGRR